jgi:hypothetical protein
MKNSFSYRGITVKVQPIINMGRKTGVKFSFTHNGEYRQAFTAQAIAAIADDLLAYNLMATEKPVNPLTQASHSAKRAAMRGSVDSSKGDLPFGG